MLLSLLVATIAAACSVTVMSPPVNAANAQGAPPTAPAAELTLLPSNGQMQHLAVGQRFGVALTEHPSAGWTWEVADFDDALRADGVDEPDFSTVPSGGDIGDKTFRFTAVRAGAARLRFIHKFRGEAREDIIYRVVVAG